MAASTTTSRITASRRPPVLTGKSRFDRRLSSILAHATNVFYEKGYEGASMRDLSRASGMSLAGMYHYFESKEKLLYLIQKHTFSTRTAVLSLFGIMNWIYTWYNPRVDGNAAKLAGEMGDIFLRGIRNGKNARKSAGVN